MYETDTQVDADGRARLLAAIDASAGVADVECRPRRIRPGTAPRGMPAVAASLTR